MNSNQNTVNKFLVVGSGLSALGSIKALNKMGIVPDVFDTSIEIEQEIIEVKDRLKNLNQKDWNESDINKILIAPGQNKKIFSIPRKTVLNSSFFYGESQGISDIKSSGILPPFSYALGGLAEGWGAAFLPPAKEDLHEWIYSHDEICQNFKEILKSMDVTGEKSELDSSFPLLKDDLHSLEYSNEATTLLSNLQKNNKNLNILIGKSRLLLNPIKEKFSPYFPTKLLTGRKFNFLESQRIEMQRDWHFQIHDAIYKPSNEIKLLAEEGKINLCSGIRVTEIQPNSDNSINVHFVIIENKKLSTASYQKVFLAAGCINTSRIILNSKKFYNTKLKVQTRGGFILPAISLKKINLPLTIKNTMPEFFIAIFDKFFSSWIHIQISLQNDLFENRLNSIKDKIPFMNVVQKIKERVFIVFVNLSSDQAGHYELQLDSEKMSIYGPRLNTLYVKRFINPLKKLNLIFKIFSIFVKAKVLVSPFGKSNSGTFHVGGAFPMKREPKNWNETNQLGELSDIKNLHLVDSSTFPTLPGTTIGLLSKVMAYCVTKKALKEGS